MFSINIKVTYDSKKLMNELQSSLVGETMHKYADMVKDDTIQGLEIGRDVRGRTFMPIEESTREVRQLRGNTGNKPLVETGAMKNSVRLSGGKSGSWDQMITLHADSYGSGSNPNAHQQGFVTKNNPTIKEKYFQFANTRIPARSWWHNEDTLENTKRIQFQLKGIAKDYFIKFNRAFTK